MDVNKLKNLSAKRTETRDFISLSDGQYLVDIPTMAFIRGMADKMRRMDHRIQYLAKRVKELENDSIVRG